MVNVVPLGFCAGSFRDAKCYVVKGSSPSRDVIGQTAG